MYAAHPPFELAGEKDSHYRLFLLNQMEVFWNAHSKRKAEGFFSPEFRDFITSMLQPSPSQRLCMADIIGHAWMQGPIATREQVVAEFARRHEVNKQRAQKEAEQKLAAKRKRRTIGNDGVSLPKLKPYDQKLAKNTAFFTDYTPEEILNEITFALEEHKI